MTVLLGQSCSLQHTNLRGRRTKSRREGTKLIQFVYRTYSGKFSLALSGSEKVFSWSYFRCMSWARHLAYYLRLLFECLAFRTLIFHFGALHNENKTQRKFPGMAYVSYAHVYWTQFYSSVALHCELGCLPDKRMWPLNVNLRCPLQHTHQAYPHPPLAHGPVHELVGGRG